jgi:hypothetical protein
MHTEAHPVKKIKLHSLIARGCGVLLVLALTACTADEVAEKETLRPISFDTYITQSQTTRADNAILAEGGIPANSSIGVYAYYHDNTTWSNASTPNFMFNQQATNSSVIQHFDYSPLKYWPNENEDKVSFIAYYPYITQAQSDLYPNDPTATDANFEQTDLNAHGLHTRLAKDGTGLPSFRFHVNDDAAKQVDFMVSALLPNLPNGTNDVTPSQADDRDELITTDRVRFVFKHMTSKIEFRILVKKEVADDLAYVTLKELKLKNIYSEGLLAPSYSTGNGTHFEWSNQSHKHTYDCQTGEVYLLMPQTLLNDAELSVSYDLAFKSNGTTYTYDGAGNPVPTYIYSYNDRSISVQLNKLKISGTDTTINQWLPGHRYVYNIIIGPHPILFTGVVAAWDDEYSFENPIKTQ